MAKLKIIYRLLVAVSEGKVQTQLESYRASKRFINFEVITDYGCIKMKFIKKFVLCVGLVALLSSCERSVTNVDYAKNGAQPDYKGKIIYPGPGFGSEGEFSSIDKAIWEFNGRKFYSSD